MFNSKSFINNSSVPASPQRITFTVKNFTGGLNNTSSPSRLNDNESPNLLNVRFRKDGLLEKRSGLTKYTFHNPAHNIEGKLRRLWVLRPEPGVETLLMHVDEDFVYVRSDGTPIFIPWGQDGVYKPVSGVQFMDKFFLVDGANHIRYFKLEDLETMDLPRIYFISTPPYEYTPNPKPATKGEWKEELFKGHRWRAWYEPCQYELEDGYKGTNMQTNKCNMLIVHKDRLYATGNPDDPNMVYISDILNPFYFPASLPVQLPPNGDKINCMRVFADSIIFGRDKDVYALHGNTNRDTEEAYTLKKINTHTGIANDHCADVIHNFMFYVGTDGNCYKLKTTNSSELILATQQLNTKVNLFEKPLSKTISDVRNCHTGYDPYNGEWWIQLGDLSLIYNYQLMAWTVYSGTENVIMFNYRDKFLLGRDRSEVMYFDDNVCYDYDYEYPELKLPIPCYWTSKDIDFGSPIRIKQIRDTYVVSEVYDSKRCDVRVKYDIDYVSVENENRVESEIALWDKAIWDKSRFIASNISRSLPIMVGRRGKTFKIWIGNGYKFKDYVTELPHQQETEVGDLFYCNGKFYVRQPRNYETREYYRELEEEELYQPMKIYEISGLYEFKGYR